MSYYNAYPDEDSYEDGYADGYDAGYANGYTDGYTNGCSYRHSDMYDDSDEDTPYISTLEERRRREREEEDEWWEQVQEQDDEYYGTYCSSIRSVTTIWLNSRGKKCRGALKMSDAYPHDDTFHTMCADTTCTCNNAAYGDIRGDYKEIDKRRKKTWHSKGALPHPWNYSKICKSERTAINRWQRSYARTFVSRLLKDSDSADKFHSGSSSRRSFKTPF